MEYVEGKTLESIILTEEPMTLQRFQRIFSQVCSGMQHAHKKGFIHRDLKPSNLMVYDTEDDTDVVKILDFGLAKACHGDDKQQNLTRTGMVMGSPPFMSPEQCRGEELDYRSDIYSLGCVMFAALTGEVPLLGDNTMATLYKHISGVPLSISEVAPHLVIPASLETVIMRTLEKFPDDRPQSMEELEQLADLGNKWLTHVLQ
jgi:eukaryotic-like serine/threonine-protein kinase